MLCAPWFSERPTPDSDVGQYRFGVLNSLSAPIRGSYSMLNDDFPALVKSIAFGCMVTRRKACSSLETVACKGAAPAKLEWSRGASCFRYDSHLHMIIDESDIIGFGNIPSLLYLLNFKN